jgi:LysR family nitrogen assimilation transcriptional regulator
MELRQLKYFIAVADSGSLSRAALEVFVAQSALSKQIAELEDELEVQLLYRGRSGVTVTEAGKTFYAYAQAVLKQLNDVKTAVRSSPKAIVGSVVLVLGQSVSGALALPLFRAARDRLPGISLHINEELMGNMIEQLRQGRVDLMVFTPLPSHEDIVFQPFVEEELYLLRGPEAVPALPEGSDVDLGFVSKQPLVLPSVQHGFATRAVLAAALEEHELPMKVVAEINSVSVFKSAVEAGMASTVMPYALAAHEVEAGRLRAHRIRPQKVARTLGICHSKHIPLTHAKAAVIELVQNIARDLCARGEWQGATYIGPASSTPPASLSSR